MKSVQQIIKSVISIVVSLVLIIGLYFWLKGDLFGEQKIKPGIVPLASESTAEEVASYLVEEKEIPVTMEAVGTLQARYRTNISPKIMATILKIHVNAGDEVKRNQLLVELDARAITARLNQAKKELEAAQSSLAQAESDFKRHAQLYEQKVESRQVYEQYKTALEVAKARVEQAKEAVKEAEVMLTYTKIYAPYDGRITDKLQNEGETAMPGQPILKMYNPQRLRLEANVPESLTQYIKVGDELKIKIDALNCETEGIVEEIVPSADIVSRTFIVRVSVPCEIGLYEGMFGRLIIPIKTRKAILVPCSAVYNVGQVEMVKVIGEEGNIERRAVKTGPKFDEFIEILSGLKPGDKVLTEP